VLGSPYVLDEDGELARARHAQRSRLSAREVGELAAAHARRVARGGATALLARAVDGADDASIERRFGSALAQRAMFIAMARSFDPDAAGGFQGYLVYELSRPATGGDASVWTIAVSDGRATASAGAATGAALTIRFQLADFVRIAAGAIDPAAPLLANRASFEGDFALAAKLPEMFGAPSPY
jgi:hypothetical protein